MLNSIFTCNICNSRNAFNCIGDWREEPSCKVCSSSVRARSVAHALAQRFYGKPLTLCDISDKTVSGIGLSDSEALATMLGRAFDYKNTSFIDGPYHLDICSPSISYIRSADFVISSDVFEHVVDVEAAFSGTSRILKRNGLLVLTVPYDSRKLTTEHYPGIKEYKTISIGCRKCVVLLFQDGSVSLAESPVFHGGEGSVLELRFFGLVPLLELLEVTGFRDIRIHSENYPEFGIFHQHDQGLVITAKLIT